MSSATLLGTVIIVRHGDRELQYTDPETLEVSPSTLTPLGSAQMYKMGDHIFSTYGVATSPTEVEGLALGRYIPAQVIVRADAGDDGGVIYDSTTALVQGIWKPNSGLHSEILANGTLIKGAMNGYQYAQIKSIDPSQDVSLNGWSSCTKFENTVSDFRSSDEFKSKKDETAQWFSQLGPWLDGRPATLENIYNVYDYMNARYLRNVSYAAGLPDHWMSYARSLVNWHENAIYSASNMNDIENIAGRTILSALRSDIQRIATISDPLRLVVNGVSHQPFISLFSMLGVTKETPSLQGMVNYGGALAFEVWSVGGPTGTIVRMRFMNGTDEGDFARYPLLDTDGDVPIKQFMDQTKSAPIDTMAAWCNACGNKVDRGCGTLNLVAEQARGHGISRAAAGAVGAACALVLALAVIALLYFFGLARFGRSRTERRRSQGSTFNRKNSRDDDAFPLGVKGSFASDRSSITKVPV